MSDFRDRLNTEQYKLLLKINKLKISYAPYEGDEDD